MFEEVTTSSRWRRPGLSYNHWHVATDTLRTIGEPSESISYLDLLRRWNRPLQAPYSHASPWDEFDVTGCVLEKLSNARWVVFGLVADTTFWWSIGDPQNVRPQLVLVY